MKGLGVHMWRKHGAMEQLDGNREKNSFNWENTWFIGIHDDVMNRHIRKHHGLEDQEYVKKCCFISWNKKGMKFITFL